MNVVVEEKRRGRAMGIYVTMVALGLALGPFVLQVVGVYGPWPFLTCAAPRPAGGLPLLPYWKKAPMIEHAADGGYGPSSSAAPLAMLAASRLRPGRAGRVQLPAGLSPSAPACSAQDRRALAVGLRDRQRRPAMADRLDGRSSRPPRRARRLRAGSAVLVALVAAVDRRSRPAIMGVIMLWGGISFAHLSGGAGAARPALQGRRHRPRQHRLQHDLHPGRPGRPAAHRGGDGCGRSIPASALERRLLLCRVAVMAALLAFHRRR